MAVRYLERTANRREKRGNGSKNGVPYEERNIMKEPLTEDDCRKFFI